MTPKPGPSLPSPLPFFTLASKFLACRSLTRNFYASSLPIRPSSTPRTGAASRPTTTLLDLSPTSPTLTLPSQAFPTMALTCSKTTLTVVQLETPRTASSSRTCCSRTLLELPPPPHRTIISSAVVDLVLILLLPASPSLVAPLQAVATSQLVGAHLESRDGDESNLVRLTFPSCILSRYDDSVRGGFPLSSQINFPGRSLSNLSCDGHGRCVRVCAGLAQHPGLCSQRQQR